ncbi:MAG: outer membrane protein assembly factor BamA [Rhodospirillaceae bacterium]|nr:outer membrane protein assembly factor BamA [Rhodospirillaceae bacterium]
MRRLIRVIGLFCMTSFLGLAPVATMAQTGESGTVQEIVVEGNQRIEPGTVLSYMLIKEGDAFDDRRVDRSLKSLFATGLFADVTIRRDGSLLIVTVVENPVINRIAYEGNSKLKDDVLDVEISLRPRVIYTRTKVQNDVKRILTLYRRKGRFAATVEPKVIQLPQNRVDLVFEINEGKWTEVKDIRFVGNGEYSDSRLREEIRTKETRWYRFLSSDDNYDPDRLTLDRELLRRFYLSSGYADFRVISAVAELTTDRKDFFITFTIEEGNRYAFGDIETDVRLTGLKPEDIADIIEIEKGDWYDAELIESTIDDLTNEIGTLGFAFIDIRPRVNRNREDKTIQVTFEVNEGPRVFVERIDIEGNVRTADEVIRREFKLVEGDAFNRAKLRQSKKKLDDLDFFEKVEVEQIPGSDPDKAAINVNVEEKSTGSLSLGFGFSTTSGVLGDIGLTERNLLGRGQSISIKAQLAAKHSQVDLSFTEPYFMDRDVAAGFNIFHSSTNLQDTSSFSTNQTGGSLRAGYPITDNLRESWAYTLKQSTISSVSSTASPYVQSEKGDSILSEIGHGLSYDRRDSKVFPTEGYIIGMSNDLAGIGGSKRYMRNVVNAGKYFPLYDQWVLSVGGRTGHIFGIGDDVSLLDRFYIGGDDLRGFATSGVGPRDKSTQDALGGEWMYKGSVELKFPLGLPQELGISGKLFSDMGSSGRINPTGSDVHDTGKMRASVGTGVAWVSPFGPVSIDMGFPVIKENFDQTEAIRVNFGTRF